MLRPGNRRQCVTAWRAHEPGSGASRTSRSCHVLDADVSPGSQVASSGKVLGLIRSELEPEETRGLTRSGDLSRMLPSEAHLMASGWHVRGSCPEVRNCAP